MNRRTVVLMACATLLSPCAPAIAQEKPYYEGKTVQLILPFGSGGATDLRARAVVPFLQKYIPGNPHIVVQNMAGAGGAAGMTYFETRSKPDGLTMAMGSAATPLRWIAKANGHNYDLGTMRLVAAFPGSMVLYGKADVARTVDDLVASKNLFSAHTSEFSLLAAETSEMATYLGFPLKRVYGYTASKDMLLAVQRGEAQISATTAVAYASEAQPLVDKGEIVPFFQFGYAVGDGIVGDKRISQIPLVWDYYRQQTGKDPKAHAEWPKVQAIATLRATGQTLFLPHGTPDEIYDIVVKAMKTIAESNDYQETMRRMSRVGDLLLVGKEAQETFDRLKLIPLEIASQLQD
jgi:tripartite-type tricarboxylate transporter receptor subunit TctC